MLAKLFRLGVISTPVMAVLAGCMSARVEELRHAPTHIGANDAVVLLAKPHLEGVGTEDEFLDCLERKLTGQEFSAHTEKAFTQGHDLPARSVIAGSPFQLYADRRFVDALYPWLEPSTAPANADGLAVLLERPGVSDRVAQMGVRYIVWVEGTTRKTDSGGSIACAAAPGVAGCIGLGWWEKTSDYEATVWDLDTKVAVGSVSTAVHGTSVMIGAIAPIPIITPVQGAACSRLAGQLKSFLISDGV